MKVSTPLMACILVGLLSTAAFSAEGPCEQDVQTLCKDVTPGGGNILACLKEHEATVSPACKDHLAKVKKKVKEAAQACQDDVMLWCGDVKQGGGCIAKCLKQHEADVSPVCKEKLQKKKP